MFQALGRLVAVHPWKICAAWLVVGIVLIFVAPSPRSQAPDDEIRLLPTRCDNVRGYRLLEQAFPQLAATCLESSPLRSPNVINVALALAVCTAVFLLILYRAPLLALMPLITAGVSAWFACKTGMILALVPGMVSDDIGYMLIIVLSFATATSYCTFLIHRYRDELAEGHTGLKAIKRSVALSCRRLMLSAAVMICALSLLAAAGIATIRFAGPALALGTVLSLATSLTIAPALLSLLGRKAFWPQRWSSRPRSWRWQDFWDRMCDFVISRPVLTSVAALLLLGPLALVGFSARSVSGGNSVTLARSVSEGGIHPSLTLRASVAEQTLSEASSSQALVLLTSHTDWNSREGRGAIDHLSRAIGYLDNVADVQSLTQPAGAGGQASGTDQDTFTSSLPATDADSPVFVTRLVVTFRSAPLVPASLATQSVILTWLRGELEHSVRPLTNVSGECFGVNVQALDMAKVTRRDRTLVTVLVVAVVFLAWWAMTRSLWRAAYLLFVGLLTCYAALGATALVCTLFLRQPYGEIDWHVWLVLLSCLLAMSADHGLRPLLRLAASAGQCG